MSNYYKQLGIPLDAEPEEIELAYEAVRKLSHTQNELRTIDVAYQTLRDPVLRVQYDQELLAEAQQTDLILPNVQEQVAKAQEQMAHYKELYAQLMQEHQQRLRLAGIVSALSGVIVLLVLALFNPQQLWLTGVLLWLGEMASAFLLLSFLGLFNQERALRNLFNLSWRWVLYFGATAYIVSNPRLEVIQSDFIYEWLPLTLLTLIPHLLLSLELIYSHIFIKHELDKKMFFKLHSKNIDRISVWVNYHRFRGRGQWRVMGALEPEMTMIEKMGFTIGILFLFSPYIVIVFAFTIIFAWALPFLLLIVGIHLISEWVKRVTKP